MSLNQAKQLWISVQAYKHDGSIHRMWSPAYLVEETPDYWALASRASLVTEADGREWITKEHAIFYLFKKKWMNVIVMQKENGICYYANIASPSILDNGYIKYIDYDLDVKLYPDGREKVLDEEEFKSHIKSLHYEEELVEKIVSSMKEVEEMADKRLFPFNDEHMYKLYQKFLDENQPFNETKKEVL